MSPSHSFSDDQQKALEAFVETSLSQVGIGPEPDPFISADSVTASFSVGPVGAHLKGWITYSPTSKIFFQIEEPASTNVGLFAGGGVLREATVLRPSKIGGKVGTFTVVGTSFAGAVVMYVDANLVMVPPIPLGGAGWPFGWGASGRVRFHDPVDGTVPLEEFA